MRTVVADSGPLRYVVVIGEVKVVYDLLGRVLIAPDVEFEPSRPQTPDSVRMWMSEPPPWVEVRPGPAVVDPELMTLDPGERATIALASTVRADAVLMDDRAGRSAALASGLEVVGTIGLLDQAARRCLLDLETAFARLRATNFRHPAALLEALLQEHRRRRTVDRKT